MSSPPATLPHAANATVPEAKIAQYLLDPNHPEGGGKAKFFLGHGYRPAQWERMAEELRLHGQSHPVSDERATVGGTNYGVTGPLTMPDGVTRTVKTVWYIGTDSTQPSLVSAYPTR